VSADGHRHWGLLALAVPAAMLAWVALGNIREDQQALSTPFRELHGARSDEERALAANLLAEAYAVLRSPELQANLRALDRRYPAVYAHGGQQEATVNDLAGYIAGDKLGSRYVPVDVFLVGGDSRETGEHYAAVTRENSAGEGRYSDVALGGFVLARYRSNDVVEKSCAINVAAHEYSHTISRTPFVYQPAFTDTSDPAATEIAGRRDRTAPVASYLVGTLAQCTWLQIKGRISAREVPACLEVFGTASGQDQRCRQFRNGEPVVLRPDLARASPPL
jgi:hypothetical protein